MIYQLLFYVCVTSNHLTGELFQKTCEFEKSSYYTSLQLCDAEGKERVGKPYHTFYGMKEVENYKCIGITVK